MPTVPQEVHFGAPWTDPVTGATWYPTARPHLIRDQGLLDRIVASGQHYVTAAFDPASPGPIGGTNPAAIASTDLTSLGNVTALQVRAFNSGAGQFSLTGLDARGPLSLGNQGGVLIGISPRDAGLTKGSLLIGQQSATGTYVNTMAEFDMDLQRWSFVTAGVEAACIDNLRNVGFGTPTPGARVHVYGGPLRVGDQDGAVVTGAADGLHASPAGAVVVSRSDGFTPLNVRRRSSDGGVVDFYRDTSPVGSVTVSTTATSFNTSSDYRLKTNVEDLSVSAAMDFLTALQPRTYEFLADPGAERWGFIAHEYQLHNPSAVTGEKDGEQMQGMAYADPKMITALVVAAQHHEAQIAAQAAEITAQAALIADLTARLEALEAAAS